MANPWRLVTLAPWFILLAGCGGGGHSSIAPTPNLGSAPGDSALSNYLGASHQYSFSAKDSNGNNYTLHLSQVPNAGVSVFNGTANAKSTVDIVSLDQNGIQVANEVRTSYFLLSPYIPLGSVGSSGTPYAVVTSSNPVPATIHVGDSAAFSNQTYYHDSSKTVIDASESSSYTVRANNVTTLNLCMDFVISGTTTQGTADGMGDGTETDCYTVDASGNAVLVSVSIAINGGSLKFQ